MFVEAVRLVAEALRDPASGVDHYLPLVPRDAGDPQPPLVTAVRILDETLNGQVALGRLPTGSLDAPDTGPWLVVSLIPGQLDQGQTAQNVGEGEVTVLVRYATGEDDPHVGTRNAGYTLRAVTWALRKLWLQLAQGALPLRNGIQFSGSDTMQLSPLYDPIEGAIVTGFLRCPLTFRDTGFPG